MKHPLAMNKRSLITIVVLALVAIGIAVGSRILNKPTANKQQTQASLADAATTGSDNAAAISKLKAAYADAATPEGKAEAAYFLAARYTLTEDHRNALKYYRQADDFYEGKNIDVVLGVASEAEALKNHDLAREYFQKAIDYYEPLAKDNATLTEYVGRLKTKLEELK